MGYRRVSTGKQRESGLGLADQGARIREFCERRGLCLIATFVETESGRSDDRPELHKALGLAKRKRAVLVIATLTRLGRRVAFIANLMEQGVPFTCADAPDDEPFILHVKASFAEEEARKISKRTKDALEQLKANGYYSKKQGRVVRLGRPENATEEGRKRGAQTNRERATAANASLLPLVLAMHADRKSLRQIASALDISPMTVSRLLARTHTP